MSGEVSSPLAAPGRSALETLRRVGRDWAPLAAVVVLALAASASGLTNGFTYDDRQVILGNARVQSLDGWWRFFAQTYWPPEQGAALYRPLTSLAFALQWAAGGGAPWPFHLASVLLYAGVCALVYRLAMLVLPATAAWIAAALFAVHPVHVEAVGNIVGQSELLVGLAATAAAALYVHARRAGPLTGGTYATLALCYAAACLTKEHGIVVPALLLALELTVLRDARPLRDRLAELRPLYLLLVLIGVAYIGVRSLIVGPVAGDDPHAALASLSLGERTLAMFTVVPHWVRLLLWPARLSADYSPPELGLLRGAAADIALGTLLLGGLAFVAWRTRRRMPAVTAGVLWTGIALLPVTNLLVVTGVLLAERTLFLPSVGAMLALGALAAHVLAELHERPPVAQRLAFAGLAVILAAGAVRSAARQLVWRDNQTLFAHTVRDSPLSYRAHYLYGASRFQAGAQRTGIRHLRAAVSLYPHDPEITVPLAHRYREAGLCREAARVYGMVLDERPDRADARSGLYVCLMQLGEYEAARSQARLGVAHGVRSRVFRRFYVSADSAVAATSGRPAGKRRHEN